jgi:hypothetical protein
VRRIAIVALARKLMVALWRYLVTGVVPTGRAASEPLNGRATMADVNQERRVTATHPGPTHTRCVDGFRLYWALPSPVKRPGPHRARRYTRRKGLSHPLTKGRRSYSAGEGGQAEAGRARRRSDQFRSGPTRQSCV